MAKHSSEGVTLRYIGITQDDVDKDFIDLELIHQKRDSLLFIDRYALKLIPNIECHKTTIAIIPLISKTDTCPKDEVVI